MLGLVGLMRLWSSPIFRARLNRQFLLGARNQAFLTEYVSGIETVKSLQMEPDVEKSYDEMLAHYLAASFNASRSATATTSSPTRSSRR